MTDSIATHERPLSLVHDVPALRSAPAAPTADELAELPTAPDLTAGVPAGVDAGPYDLARVLDELVADVEGMRRKLIATPPGGFAVSAADHQRADELLDLLDRCARILAERA